MTNENDAGIQLPQGERGQSQSWLRTLTEWKTQLAALVAAPFLGIGFVFDFLLRAKDFPELASAMWGVFGFFVGTFFFFFSLMCAAMAASGLGAYERDLRAYGWRRQVRVWTSRFFTVCACFSLIFLGVWFLSTSTDGFGSFVSPYVAWLKAHTL